MKAEFWKQRWEEGQIGFHQGETNPHLLSYWNAMDVEGGTVLVPLCGKSLDMLWLAGQGHKVVGIELSEIAVRDFLSENKLQATESKQGTLKRFSTGDIDVLQGDFFDYKPDTMITAVFDRASLIAMPPEMRRQYADHLTQMLESGTPVLLVTMEYDQNEMDGPPFSVPETDVLSLYQQYFELQLLEEYDLLDEQPQFKAKGLTALKERAYKMVKK